MSDLIRIERKLDKLIKLVEQKQKPLWVKASIITGLTGWNPQKMRSARENGYVKFKDQGKNGQKDYWYELTSVHEKFIKKNI